ncbi:Omp28-related outer membrane protein (plasmid) [Bernardetia sp. OM2101]|uniref:Omp28-related outer membrane protein n=1 Tax=Bernardetia sp. OM2101 TaxID=3344876 RepID=UPI0035D110F6
MKKFSIYVLLSLLFFACNSRQEEIEDEVNKPVENEEKIPASFTQKILIEHASRVSAGMSMQGQEYISVYKEQYQDRIIPVSIHYNEFEVKQVTDYFDETYEFYKCVPMGFVNRMQSNFHRNLGLYVSLPPHDWASVIDSLEKRDKTSSGIALQTTYNQENKVVNVTAKIATNNKFDITGKYKLIIYLTEDEVIYPQNNIYSGDDFYIRHAFGEKYYYLPPVINDFSHNALLRNVFTSGEGDDIEIPKTGIVTEKSYSINLTNEKYQNCNVVAALLKQDRNGIFQVENAQIAKLGENQAWD